MVNLKDRFDEIVKILSNNSISEQDKYMVINDEIRSVVETINHKLVLHATGHEKEDSSFKWVKSNLFRIPRRISSIVNPRVCANFLFANCGVAENIAKCTHTHFKTDEKDFPIIKNVLEDSSCYRENIRNSSQCYKNARNVQSIFIYPINICYNYGDDLQNLIYYSKETIFEIYEFYNIENLYRTYYFDFNINQFRYIHSNKIVSPNYLKHEALFHLERLPEFGYLFELGRLNLQFAQWFPEIVKENLSKIETELQLNEQTKQNYIRFIMVKLSELGVPVQQTNIETISSFGNSNNGQRNFIVHTDNGETVGIKVSLRRYGATKDKLTFNKELVTKHQLINNL